MRREPDGTIVLSRRNLLTLLHKLDMPGSHRTLVSPAEGVVVLAEDDATHYSHPSRRGEPAGEVHPASETFVEKHSKPKRTLNDALGGLKL